MFCTLTVFLGCSSRGKLGALPGTLRTSTSLTQSRTTRCQGVSDIRSGPTALLQFVGASGSPSPASGNADELGEFLTVRWSLLFASPPLICVAPSRPPVLPTFFVVVRERGANALSPSLPARTNPLPFTHATVPVPLLQCLGLQKYLELFRKEEVDFPTLITMTEADLKAIGLTLFGPRRKIASAIKRWHEQHAGSDLDLVTMQMQRLTPQ